jgi:hypothetical protein
MQLLHHGAHGREAGEESRSWFVTKIVAEDGRVVAHLADQLGHLLAGGDRVDVRPIVAGASRIMDDRHQPRGVAGVERLRRNEPGDRQSARAHLGENCRVVGRPIPPHHGKDVGGFVRGNSLSRERH